MRQRPRMRHPIPPGLGYLILPDLLVLGLSLGLAPAAQAGALVPSKASQLVTVRQTGAQGACSFPDQDEFDVRIERDGNVTPFSIPPGMVFVVTSIEWFSVGVTFPETLGASQYFVVAPPGNNALAVVPGIVGPRGGGGSMSLGPAGIVMGSGGHLCGSTGSLAVGGYGALHGFLAKDR